MRKPITKFGLLAALITTLCAAQETSVQKEGSNWVSVVSGSLSGVRNLHIQVEIGAVRVQGGSTQGINYVIRNRSYEGSEDRARKQLEGYKVSSYVRGDTAFITGEWENGHPHKFNSEITVNVPRDLDLVKIETDGGEISTSGISGRLEAQTGGGTLKVLSASGPIKGETGSGNIELWGVPSAHVETGSGAITAKFVRGNSGTGSSILETGVGDITVYLVSNVNLTVHASIEAANGQQIVSDFPDIKVSSEGGQWGPKLVSAEGSVNGGGPVLKVRTTMGNIYFRRAQ